MAFIPLPFRDSEQIYKVQSDDRRYYVRILSDSLAIKRSYKPILKKIEKTSDIDVVDSYNAILTDEEMRNLFYFEDDTHFWVLLNPFPEYEKNSNNFSKKFFDRDGVNIRFFLRIKNVQRKNGTLLTAESSLSTDTIIFAILPFDEVEKIALASKISSEALKKTGLEENLKKAEVFDAKFESFILKQKAKGGTNDNGTTKIQG